MEQWNGNIRGNGLPNSRYGKNDGFSLLEVLVAITITGLVITVLSGALIQNSRNQHLLEVRAVSQILGQGKLSEIISGGESGSFGDFTAPYDHYHWSTSEETLPDGYTKISLTVEWRDTSVSHQTILIGYSHPE